MIRTPHHTTRAARAERPRAWAAYAAAAWAWLFAAPHFYWGVGGATGLDTALTRTFVEERSGWFLALNWAIGALCVAGGLVALAAVRPFGRRLPSRLVRTLAWVGCILLALRALDIYLEFGLALTGIRTVPADARDELSRLARWFLFLWLPWFALGAGLWGALASRPRTRRTGPGRGDRGRVNEKEST